MPQVVKKFCETKDLKVTDREKRKILSLYRDDIAKHAKRYAGKVRRIFDEIPGQLSKHEKKFSLSSLGKGSKMRSYEDAFLWLDDAMVVSPCYNTTEPNVGLRLNMDSSAFKCYMADTGLLVSHAFDDKALAAEDIHKRLLLGNLEINEGMLMENIVPIEVKSAKRYSTNSLDKFTVKYKAQSDSPIVLHTKDLSIKDGVTYLPVYMTPML